MAKTSVTIVGSKEQVIQFLMPYSPAESARFLLPKEPRPGFMQLETITRDGQRGFILLERSNIMLVLLNEDEGERKVQPVHLDTSKVSPLR